MRPSVAIWIVLLTVAAQARAADGAKAILDRAIRAHGGADKLAKYHTLPLHTKWKGTIQGSRAANISMEMFQQGDKARLVMEMMAEGMNIKQVSVHNGEKSWRQVSSGQINRVTESRADAKQREERRYQNRITTLDFSEAKDVTLTRIEDINVADKLTADRSHQSRAVSALPPAGIRVSSKGYPDVELYFDKKSGMLVKHVNRTAVVSQETVVGTIKKAVVKPYVSEVILSNYREFNGYRIATKTMQFTNGKKESELEITDFEILKKIDDSVFEKPGQENKPEKE